MRYCDPQRSIRMEAIASIKRILRRGKRFSRTHRKSKKRVDSLYQLDPDADADEAYTSAYRLPTAPALAKPDDSWPYCDACGYAGFALPPSRYCPCPWDTRDTAQNARSTP